MAPDTSTKRQGDIASTLQPSVETAAEGAASLPESKQPSHDHQLGNPANNVDETADSQRQSPFRGIPITYDPDTYDPDVRMPWTPEPEPYDAKAYTAWGRKHFGEDWYEQREIMLKERNIYRRTALYSTRQNALRLMEQTIEGRPFEPLIGVLDKNWQRLWARLSKVLPSVEHESDAALPAPGVNNSNGGDSSDQSNTGGSSTPPPVYGDRDDAPYPDDPWEQLEWQRRHYNWDEEEYQFHRIFLKEGLIDSARCRYENEPGDQKRREEWDAIVELKWKRDPEYEPKQRHFKLRTIGWTTEQIDAADRADEAAAKWRRENPQSPSDTQAEWNEKRKAAEIPMYGGAPTSFEREEYQIWRQNIHSRVSAQRAQIENPTASDTPAAPRAKPSSRKTSGGRITKGTTRTQNAANSRSRSQRASLTPAETSMPQLSTRLTQAPNKPDGNAAPVSSETPKGQPCDERGADAIEDEVLRSETRMRSKKIYKKLRASRRLAGEPPECGIFAEQSMGTSFHETQPPSPTNARKPKSSGRRNRAPSKKKSVAA